MLKLLLSGEMEQSELLRYYNSNIAYVILPEQINGFVFNYKGINNIYINKNLSYYKRKKTLLHELAHIELNQLCQSDKDLFAFHIQEYEDEADKYIKQILDEIKKEVWVMEKNITKSIFIVFIISLVLGLLGLLIDIATGLKILGFSLLFLVMYFVCINTLGQKEKEDKDKQEMDQQGYKKIINNFWVSEELKKLKINNSIYNFENILGYELIEDGNTIVNTTGKKKASVGKAIVGGALLGDAGAIIGGTSGKTSSKSVETHYCNNLKLKITINDLTNPCEFLKFIDYQTKKDTNKYKTSYENIQKVMSIIDIIIKSK